MNPAEREAAIDAMEARMRVEGIGERMDALDAEHGPHYYDRDGKPMSFVRWAAAMEVDPESRIVAHTWLVADTAIVLVSTVWLGLDHSFGFTNGVPRIFETMIFGVPWSDEDEYQERYATEVGAEAGHDRALATVRDRLPGCIEVSEDEARRRSEDL